MRYHTIPIYILRNHRLRHSYDLYDKKHNLNIKISFFLDLSQKWPIFEKDEFVT